MTKTIGVLALQGGFQAHVLALARLGYNATLVRQASQLLGLDGLILPGGESTTQLQLLERYKMREPLLAAASSGMPILATCAGLVLCATRVTEPEQRSLGLLEITVQRNGFGRQLNSFEARSDDGCLPLCFIRAPRIVEVPPRGDRKNKVKVLATYENEPVMVRQDNVTGASFHPELTDDLSVHSAVFSLTAS